MTIKDQLDTAKQDLYMEISAAIEKFQSSTGLHLIGVRYVDSSYAVWPKTHFVGFKLQIDVGNEI